LRKYAKFSVIFIALNVCFVLFPKTTKIPAALYPFSVSIQFALSPEVYIYQPASNYAGEFAFTFDTGVSFEYRFARFFALDSGIFVNTGYHYQEIRVKRIGYDEIRSIRMNNVDLFFQYRLSTKIYFPNPITLNKNYKLQFAFRLGFILDAWLMSYYHLTNNGAFVSQGQMFSGEPDGPNGQGDYLTFGEYYDYSRIYNQVNAGAHVAFCINVYNSKKISISPEIGYIFYIAPFTDGKKGDIPITGMNSFLARNNGGEGDKELMDYRMQIVASISIAFSAGEWGSNLYDLKIMKKK
jgi:hypothetical protein